MFESGSLCSLSSIYPAFASWSLQWCRSCWFRCRHVRRMSFKQLHFSIPWRMKSGNETWIICNKILGTYTGIFEFGTSAHSVTSTWHEFLGNCSPVALVGCAAGRSEECVHNRWTFSQPRLTNSFQHPLKTFKWDMNCLQQHTRDA